MTIDLESISSPARVANPEEGISAEELQLAARNHGMPLESLRWDITPPGMHYLLIHYDIPAIDPNTFELVIDGLVETPLSLDLEAIKSRPQVSSVVTLECAGNGRAQLLPRPVSQPWLSEAVGTARWTGTPLASLLREAGIDDGAVDVDSGSDERERHARVRDERCTASSPARGSAPADRSGLVRHGAREVAAPHHRCPGAVRGISDAGLPIT